MWRTICGAAGALLCRRSTVHVYTDGSHDAATLPHPTSSWAVTVADEWLHGCYAGLPADEQLLQPGMWLARHHRRQHPLHARCLPAELQAIARALAMFPASCTLHIHSDSQASLAAMRTYEQHTNERKRMRMARARCCSSSATCCSGARQQAAASLASRARAHPLTDQHSVGNRLSDYQANLARRRPERSLPLGLQELPLQLASRSCTSGTSAARACSSSMTSAGRPWRS